MLFEQLQIRHLGAREIGPHGGTGVFPCRTIGIEDANAQQISRVVAASLADVEVWETSHKHGVDVTRLVGEDQALAHEGDGEGVAIAAEHALNVLKIAAPHCRLAQLHEVIETQYRIPLRCLWYRLAPVGTRKAALTTEETQPSIQGVDDEADEGEKREVVVKGVRIIRHVCLACETDCMPLLVSTNYLKNQEKEPRVQLFS